MTEPLRIFVTGGHGQVGTDLVNVAMSSGHVAVGASRRGPTRIDVTDRDSLHRAVERFTPDVVIHAAAWTDVDACEDDPATAHQVNAVGTSNAAEAAHSVGAHLVYLSTDYIFDGTKATPYVETDVPNPRSAYGRSKLAGEQATGPDDTVVRTSWVSGRHGSNVVATILRLAVDRPILHFVDDQIGHPTFTESLAPAVLDLATSCTAGVFHVTNQGLVSWFQFARQVMAAAELDPNRVHPITTAELHPRRAAARPASSALDNAAWLASGRAPLPDFGGPLARLVRQVKTG